MKEKITLIIVDLQYDFYSQSGTLCVSGGAEAANKIKDLILKNSDNIGNIIFTLDWHPSNHCSFKENNGQWPMHCVQYTQGASIHPAVMKTVLGLEIPYHVYLKGQDPKKEEYGAFSKYLDQLDLEADYKNLVICGIAGDYCVLETLKNIKDATDDIKVFMPGIASIDGGKALKEYMEKENVKEFNYGLENCN